MSNATLIVIAVFAVAAIAVFLYVTLRDVKTSPPGVKPFHGLLPVEVHPAPIVVPSARPMRVLLAVDGSPCSDHAVQSVAMRPWPAGTEIEIVTVVTTRMPNVPDVLLMAEAAHHEALEADRERAPVRAARAEQSLRTKPGVSVSQRVLEGDPTAAILEEAGRWLADLIVVGSHGYGVVKRGVLGSVSNAVAHHAACSVEIVRCPAAS
jgi:nucleotide-binding universal stress UspA family protein